MYIAFNATAGRHDAATTHTSELAQALTQEGHHVTTFISAGKTPTKSHAESYTEVIVSAPPNSKNKLRQVAALLKKNVQFYRAVIRHSKKADVIYERHNSGSFVGVLVAWRLRKPLFYEMNSLTAEEALIDHGVEKSVLYSLLKSLVRFQSKQARAIITQTEELKLLIAEIYKATNIVVVPNGVQKSLLKPLKHSAPKHTDLRLVYVGSIDMYHNLDIILETFKDTGSHVQLDIVGSGPRLQELQKLYPQKHFVFHGELPHGEALKIANKADVGLASYDIEAPLFRKYGFFFCPLKLLEYASLSKPTILLGPSNSFVAVFEKSQATIVAENSAGLDKIVSTLNKNRQKLTVMARNALVLAEHYSWQYAAQTTVGVFYEDV